MKIIGSALPVGRMMRPNISVFACADKAAMQSVVLILLALVPSIGLSEEAWVTSIGTSSKWAAFACKDYWVTKVCRTDKDYSNPGSLPSIVSVGDTISYSDIDDKRKQFVVRYINFFVFEKDVDSNSGGKRLTARKGETSCMLYDAMSRAATRDTEYPSKIVIKDCRVLK